MKKIVFSLLFSVVQLCLLAQSENLITVNSKISEVTVYLTAGEIRHTADVQLKAGKNRIVFTGLSRFLQPSSVQVAFEKQVEILSVSAESNFLNAEKLEPRIALLKDSIEMVNDAITQLGNQISAYNSEKSLLNSNQSIRSDQAGVTMTELQKAADYFRERSLQINNAVSSLSKKVTEQNTTLSSLNKQLAELNYQHNPERKEVVVVVEATTAVSSPVYLRYLVGKAGWAASYDIVVEDITKPVELKYKALAYNNTGINWENVKLKFSSADPLQSASKPIMTAWQLNYGMTVDDLEANFFAKRDQTYGWQYDTTINYSVVAVSELNVEFEIEKPYSIPSDAKPYLIDIAQYTLNATYQYFSVPKVDLSTFLLAKVSGWESLNLIDGQANIYFGNTYVGQSAINTRNVEDTLDLSLGRDNKVLITRTKKEDFSSKKLIGTNRVESFTYEIVVKNNRDLPIDIEVQDQVPVSQQSDIVVSVDEISGAEMDIITGALTWNAHLNPDETVKYVISFSVRYPKNKSLQLRKSKSVYAPSF